ncbi:MAG TPA: zf-HC2 domain-containing protein [Bryobacteraceae bacterium]|jgi:anti-sigma factor RsiW
MICLTKNEQGAELLTAYLAKTLDADGMAEVHSHIRECADCRGLAAVWARLDEFAAPEVAPGFDARLYARIAAKAAQRPWWRRLLWRPAIPLVAAGALVALALFVQGPRTPDVSKQPSQADIEQVAQAVDDLDLLTSIPR